VSHDVLVVIGTGGMGTAIARRLGPGRQILLAGRREGVLDRLADTLRGQGHEVRTQRVDVASGESVKNLAELAGSLGPVRYLAHTAGLSPVQAEVAAVTAVDLVGVAHVLEAFTPVIADGGAGVVISSMAAHYPYPIDAETELALATMPADALARLPALQPDQFENGGMAYIFAKKANLIRVRAIAATWGTRNARINTISPGVILTSMGQAELSGPMGEFMRHMVENAGVRRYGTPDDVAAAADFLLGPQSSFITGTDLLVDGGVTALVAAAPR
jgi:NAD(P)-dependent dehydrogenase (short-subunit alcohol dehydrogenase family)